MTTDENFPVYTEMVKEMAENKGAKLLLQKPYSNHKGDCYLHIVLVKWRGEFVTWLANTQEKGFGWGNYFHPERDSKALEKATKDYHKRGFYQQPQTETETDYTTEVSYLITLKDESKYTLTVSLDKE